MVQFIALLIELFAATLPLLVAGLFDLALTYFGFKPFITKPVCEVVIKSYKKIFTDLIFRRDQSKSKIAPHSPVAHSKFHHQVNQNHSPEIDENTRYLDRDKINKLSIRIEGIDINLERLRASQDFNNNRKKRAEFKNLVKIKDSLKKQIKNIIDNPADHQRKFVRIPVNDAGSPDIFAKISGWMPFIIVLATCYFAYPTIRPWLKADNYEKTYDSPTGRPTLTQQNGLRR